MLNPCILDLRPIAQVYKLFKAEVTVKLVLGLRGGKKIVRNKGENQRLYLGTKT